MRKKWLSMVVTSLALVTFLAGCGSSTTASTEASKDSSDGKDSKARVVKIAYDQASKPISYTDDKGNPTGYDVEAMKLVSQLLPQYKFEFVGTSSDDLLLGVEQGKYQVGIKNAFWTEERTKKFIFPQRIPGLKQHRTCVEEKE
ncbi:transporter substrate-binding domain-containing protein [Paenibacillus sp. JTLBN-2024]